MIKHRNPIAFKFVGAFVKPDERLLTRRGSAWAYRFAADDADSLSATISSSKVTQTGL